jgi:hypothetical protein
MQYIAESGLFTDELTDLSTGTSPGFLQTGTVTDPLDERMLPTSPTTTSYTGGFSYSALQQTRGVANQAIGALAEYDDSLPALRGELYAIQGYSELLLADLFCSGVPLSTLDYKGDYTYHAGSTTQQVYADALMKLDSAIALAGDSTRILNFARVVKGRVLLQMDSVSAAAHMVAEIPTDFADSIALPLGTQRSGWSDRLAGVGSVADSEGGHGFPYRTGDPRTKTIAISRESPLPPLYFPLKYDYAGNSVGYVQFTVASGVEARLIEAEAALRAKDYGTWLSILNIVRSTVTVRGQTEALGMLTDPGDSPRDSARVALLFHERAAWFFLDGHRQGDLRRLVRQYHWSQAAAYPSGPYLAPGLGFYGSDITVPIPADENPNPLSHGCFDRNA